MGHFHPRIGDTKAPIDSDAGLVSFSLPGCNLLGQLLAGGNPSVQALALPHRELQLRHVQLTGMLGGVVKLQWLRQPPRFLRCKGRIQRRTMRIQVVEHDPNCLRRRIQNLAEVLHLLGKVALGPLLGHGYLAVAGQRFHDQKQVHCPGAAVH
jgi:hypothetical protein